MSAKIKKEIQIILAEHIGAGVKVEALFPLGGGCINESAKVKTNQGLFFAKWNDADKHPKMFESEAKGLKLLGDADEIKIPKVISQKKADETDFLILEFVESGTASSFFWNDFGRLLVNLHKHTSGKFGLDYDNYIGSLPQSNRWYDAWDEFFIMERLEPQIKMAVDFKRISSSVNLRFQKLFSKIEQIFPKELPSLLHGDLWNGNYLIDSRGEPCLIDPAVYYGHREMDIAMTKLFGGFSPEFYEAYGEQFPLEKGWQKRTDICNLYPLMVHVNLFGGRYVIQVEDILGRFS